MRISVRVPATSANLGPGFDSFGVAVDIWNSVEIDTDATGVSWEGEGADELPTDGSDMISRAMQQAADERDAVLPVFSLHGTNAIPLERGLGSSSAAAVAGIAAALVLLSEDPTLDLHEVFAVAAAFEGHPDNAAPAVYGGFTIVYGSDGPPIRLQPSDALHPVVLVPDDVRLPTEAARKALAPTVSLADTIFTASHAAGLALALTGGDQRLLQETLQDRIHQDVRLALVPSVRDMFKRLQAEGFPVCVSGAGPTLLAFEPAEGALDVQDVGWSVSRPGFTERGVEALIT